MLRSNDAEDPELLRRRVYKAIEIVNGYFDEPILTLDKQNRQVILKPYTPLIVAKRECERFTSRTPDDPSTKRNLFTAVNNRRSDSQA
jgi:hypothetical protein